MDSLLWPCNVYIKNGDLEAILLFENLKLIENFKPPIIINYYQLESNLEDGIKKKDQI